VARNRAAYLPALAGSLENLAARLAGVRRMSDGVAAARTAVALWTELAGENPAAYRDRVVEATLLAERLADDSRSLDSG
jgi:hypothetical protein